MTEELQLTLTGILEELRVLEIEFARLAEDGPPHSTRRSPAGDREVAALGSMYGPPLPKDYIEFLSISNGWDRYAFVGTFLGTQDHREKWLEISLSNMEMHFSEEGRPFPIPDSAIPIVANDFNDEKLLYEPGSELPFREYRYADTTNEFEDLAAYFAEIARRMRSSINYQKSGM